MKRRGEISDIQNQNEKQSIQRHVKKKRVVKSRIHDSKPISDFDEHLAENLHKLRLSAAVQKREQYMKKKKARTKSKKNETFYF